jgi:hypothetical protein
MTDAHHEIAKAVRAAVRAGARTADAVWGELEAAKLMPLRSEIDAALRAEVAAGRVRKRRVTVYEWVGAVPTARDRSV